MREQIQAVAEKILMSLTFFAMRRSNRGTRAQRGWQVSVFGDILNPAEHDPKSPDQSFKLF